MTPTATAAITTHHATGIPVVRAIIVEAFQIARAGQHASRQIYAVLLRERLDHDEDACPNSNERGPERHVTLRRVAYSSPYAPPEQRGEEEEE